MHSLLPIFLVRPLLFQPDFAFVQEGGYSLTLFDQRTIDMATILVMDDDWAVRSVMKRMLEMHAHKVLSFEDAGQALRSVDFDTVDLVITDLMMPTPGDQAIKTIRNRGIKVPIIVMSGCCMSREGMDRLRSIGANHYLEKPFHLTELMQTIEVCLN